MGRRLGQIKINFPLILRSTCYLTRGLHEAARLKTAFLQGETQELAGAWLKSSDPLKLTSIFEGMF